MKNINIYYLSFTRTCVETPIQGSESQRPAISSRRGENGDCVQFIFFAIPKSLIWMDKVLYILLMNYIIIRVRYTCNILSTKNKDTSKYAYTLSFFNV